MIVCRLLEDLNRSQHLGGVFRMMGDHLVVGERVAFHALDCQV